MKKSLFVLLIVLCVGCEMNDLKHEDLSSRKIEEAAREIAFPNVKGELISLGGSGDEEVVVVQKNGRYVWLGDIILTQNQVDILKRNKSSNVKDRTALNSPTALWPGAKIFYQIDPGLPNQSRVTDAIAHWQTMLPQVTFVVRTNQANFVKFVPSSGCSSDLGMIGGQQTINLGTDCSTGNVIHEIGHALGLLHEQTRTDRNSFITVHNENIIPGLEFNFNRYVDEGIAGFEIGTLDFGSIMMYPSNAFSVNGFPTITTTAGATFGAQRTALSQGDVDIASILHGGPFAMVRTELVESGSDNGHEYNIREFFVDFFQDRALTIPVNLPTNITLRYYKSFQEVYPNPNVQTYEYTVNLTGGSHSYALDLFATNDCYYDYQGVVIGNCNNTWLELREGHNYNMSVFY